MNSKFTIFVVLATVVQSSFANLQLPLLPGLQVAIPQVTIPVFGLSKEKSAEFNRIVETEKTSLQAEFGAINPIFDVLEILTAIRKYNLTAKADVVSSFVAKAVLNTKNASDHTFTTIPVILEEACPAAGTIRTTVYTEIENAYAQGASAINLAASGNYTDVRTDFQVFSLSSQQSAENVMRKIFDAIRACVNTDNADTLAAIKVRENTTIKRVRYTVGVMFDAIKIFAAGIPTESNSRVNVVPDIESHREQAKVAVRDVLEHTFGSLRGLYLSTHLNQTESAASLTSNQYAQIVSKSRFRAGGETMLDVVEGYLTKLKLGLSEGCNDDSSAINAAQAITAANYKAGFRALVDSVPTTDPVISKSAKAAGEFLDNFADSIAVSYYNALRLARGQRSTHYSATVIEIKSIRTALHAVYPSFVWSIFTLIQLGSGSQDGLKNLHDDGLAEAQRYLDDIFDSILVMAKACHGIEAVSENDYNTLQKSRNGVGSTVNSFTFGISTGRVSIVKSIAAIQIRIPILNIGVGLNSLGLLG